MASLVEVMRGSLNLSVARVGLSRRKFYNIKITQDGHLAWVIFDFEFVQDSKVARYGVEAWQVVKTTGAAASANRANHRRIG